MFSKFTSPFGKGKKSATAKPRAVNKKSGGKTNTTAVRVSSRAFVAAPEALGSGDK